MTTHGDDWPAARRGRTLALDSDEALRLLAAKKVGRLALVADGAPTIVPVDFDLADGRVVVRVPADSSVARAVGSPVAFEVDEFDDLLEAGWSVVVSGTAELFSEPAPDGSPGNPPAGQDHDVRSLLVAVPIDRVTGRQLVPD